MNTRLTVKQELFISHYLANGGNGTAAAREAGYKGSDETLRSTAKENLTKPHIKAEIEEAQNKLKEQLHATALDKRAMLWASAKKAFADEPILDHEGNQTGEYRFDSGGVVRAIAELNKMDGDYAAKKIDSKQSITIVTGEDEQGLF